MHARASGSVLALRPPSTSDLAEARRVLRQQSSALLQMAGRLDASFSRAVDLLLATQGRVAVSGVGKSGIVAHKIAATLASTGTPAFFVNAAEAHHGDLGMITAADTVLVLSRSGETVEVVGLLPHLRRLGVPIVALVGQMGSTLANEADVALDVTVERDEEHNTWMLHIDDRATGYSRVHRVGPEFVLAGEYRTLAATYAEIKGMVQSLRQGPVEIAVLGGGKPAEPEPEEAAEAADEGLTADEADALNAIGVAQAAPTPAARTPAASAATSCAVARAEAAPKRARELRRAAA